MADFETPDAKASPCTFNFQIPKLGSFPKFALPPIPAFPKIPIPPLPLTLSCKASDPVDVAGDAPYGGGRVAKSDPDPDLVEQ